MYRPAPVAALLVGRALDDAETFVGRRHGADEVAHRVALARAWAGAEATPARHAAWSLQLLAERVRNEAARATTHFASTGTDAGLPAAVHRAEAGLARALGAGGSTRARLVPDRAGVAAAVAELERAFAAVVDGLRRAEPAKAMLPAEAGDVVGAARRAPATLLEQLRAEAPALVDAVDEDPPLAAASEGGGSGSALTVAGRVTYGLRLAAGCISAAGCSTPAERLFKPGGVAAELFARVGDTRALALLMAALDPSLHWTLAGAAADA